MKKLKLFILFIFCISFTFGGFVFLPYNNANAQNVEIEALPEQSCDATQFKALLKDWDDLHSAWDNFQIILTEDVELTKDDMESYTGIGTEAIPFKGVFNGKGHTILINGYNFDATVTGNGDSQYTGIFGYCGKGAQIKNLRVLSSSDSDINLITNNCNFSYMGILAGYVTGTTFDNIQIDVKNIAINSNFDNSINFGLLAGVMDNSSVANNIICRANNVKNLTFSRNDEQVCSFGGVCGKFINSIIHFAIVGINFDVHIEQSFLGQINLGGVSGIVWQGASEIVNVALNCQMPASVDGLVFSGEVVGNILSPSPNQNEEFNNISYIHFNGNPENVFGNKGDYKYDIRNYNCHITYSSLSINDIKYFAIEPNEWYLSIGIWDFDRVWIMTASGMELQCFNDDFSVTAEDVVLTDNDSIVILKLTNRADISNKKFSFGDIVRLQYEFEQPVSGGTTINMKNYFELCDIRLNSIKKGDIRTINEGQPNEDYKISYDASDDYSISKLDNGFILTINSLDNSTSGNYTITVNPKEFSSKFTSRLYSNSGYVEGADGTAGYIYNVNSSVTDSVSWEPILVYNGRTISVQTREISSVYNFEGWYLDVDGNPLTADTQLTSSSVYRLDFVFGSGNFLGNLNIYARYTDNSRRLTFSIDAGIEKVLIEGQTISGVETQQIAVPKDKMQVLIEIYVRDNYNFDVENFVAVVETYKAKLTIMPDDEQKEGFKYYKFSLDISSISDQQVANNLSINVSTEPINQKDMTLIWIIVGSVAGGIVLIGLIILLIILLKRRNSFKGGGRIKKSNYKKMYY